MAIFRIKKLERSLPKRLKLLYPKNTLKNVLKYNYNFQQINQKQKGNKRKQTESVQNYNIKHVETYLMLTVVRC